MKTFVLSLSVVALAAASHLAAAQPQKDPNLEIVELQLSPAALPRPALRHRLAPSYLDQAPGNAATLYAKAFLLLAQQPKADEPTAEKYLKWLETPPSELPRAEVAAFLANYRSALREVEMAARRPQCDWDLPIRETDDVMGILLPEVAAARDVGRLLALRARLQIAEQKYEQAVDSLRSGYTLARQVARQPLLVSGLVGNAIAAMMNAQVQALAQSPKSPNLYWALAGLPDPLVDLRPAFELESVTVYLMFPELQPARRYNRSPEQWRVFALGLLAQLKALTEGSTEPAGLLETLTDAAKAATWLASAAPKAKAGLVAMGHARAEVEAMTPEQAVAIHTAETFDDLRDEMFKWFYLPYWQARERAQRAERELTAEGKQREVVPLASLLLPAVGKAHFSAARLQRQVAALRCIEALRAYAARHDGKLPARLDDLTETPLPPNPVTGKPFPYRLEGAGAVLSADGPADLPRVEYRLTIAKP